MTLPSRKLPAVSHQEIESLVQEHGGLVLVVEGRWRYHVDGCPTLDDADLEEGDVLDIREEGFTACPCCRPDRVLADEARADLVVAQTQAFATAAMPAVAPHAAPRPLPPAVPALGRLHQRHLHWRVGARALWWLCLPPLAIACWAAAQTSRPRRVTGWALAGAALVFFVVSAFSPSGQSTPASVQARTASAGLAPTMRTPTGNRPPSATPQRTAQSTPGPVGRVPSAASAAPPSAAIVSRPGSSTAVRLPVVSRAPATRAVPRTSRPSAVRAAAAFDNCADLHGAYPHGVGMPGAVDHVSGSTQPVTNFARSSAVYQANSGSDRDGDDIACEQP